jgi:integrase
MAKGSKKTGDDKPQKPRPDFPLFPHATKRWAKKIKGKMQYFGPWSDPAGALQKYLDTKDDLYAGRKPRPKTPGFTLLELVNRFCNAKDVLKQNGELSPRMLQSYVSTCSHVLKAIGKHRLVSDLESGDFEQLRAVLAVGRGPVSLGNEINKTRILFRYAYESGAIDRPIRFGPHFKRPSQKMLRQARNAKGLRMFEAAEIRAILGKASVAVRAMTLLACNGGLGQTDLALLPFSAVDLKRGWIDYPRPKTAIGRRIPLWPETVKAIQDWLPIRPTPSDDADAALLFITRRGSRWVRAKGEKAVWIDSIGLEFNKVLHVLNLKRPGLAFYALRHTLETIASETRDQPAVDAIMGHAAAGNDMAAVYRERIGDDRLRAVVDHVRGWLLPTKKAPRKGTPKK